MKTNRFRAIIQSGLILSGLLIIPLAAWAAPGWQIVGGDRGVAPANASKMLFGSNPLLVYSDQGTISGVTISGSTWQTMASSGSSGTIYDAVSVNGTAYVLYADNVLSGVYVKQTNGITWSNVGSAVASECDRAKMSVTLDGNIAVACSDPVGTISVKYYSGGSWATVGGGD